MFEIRVGGGGLNEPSKWLYFIFIYEVEENVLNILSLNAAEDCIFASIYVYCTLLTIWAKRCAIHEQTGESTI